MQDFFKRVVEFFRDEDGPTATEYAVMMALIALVCLATISAVGNQASGTFSDIAKKLEGSRSGQVP